MIIQVYVNMNSTSVRIVYAKCIIAKENFYKLSYSGEVNARAVNFVHFLGYIKI